MYVPRSSRLFGPRCATAMKYDIAWHAARATAVPAIVPGSARWNAVLAAWRA